MPIRLSQVKSLCNSSELALVQASRRPELNKLTPARLKQHAERARKLFDKWQDQSRSQARSRRREAGFSDDQTRAELKARIFQEALQKFEERLAELEADGAAAAGGPKTTAKPKKARSREHRQARADVRAALAETEADLNIQSRTPLPTAHLAPAENTASPADRSATAPETTPPPKQTPLAATPEQASLRPAKPLTGKRRKRPAPPPAHRDKPVGGSPASE